MSGHLSSVRGCTGPDASAPPLPFLGRVPSSKVLAMFEAGLLLAAPLAGAASQSKAKAFGRSRSCLEAGRRPWRQDTRCS